MDVSPNRTIVGSFFMGTFVMAIATRLLLVNGR